MANIPKVWNGTAFVELEAAATVPPAASTTVVGIVQLTDSTSSTSTTTAATPNSVKSAFDLAGTAIPKDTVTAAGDILYASGSATVARLGIGTASQVLSVSGGVPAWTTIGASGGILKYEEFTSSGSFVIPATASGSALMVVEIVGSGGGGGGGQVSATSTAGYGGNGGGGGHYGLFTSPVASYGTAGGTVTVTIGAGGAGGTAKTSGDSTTGLQGGATSFGTSTVGGNQFASSGFIVSGGGVFPYEARQGVAAIRNAGTAAGTGTSLRYGASYTAGPYGSWGGGPGYQISQNYSSGDDNDFGGGGGGSGGGITTGNVATQGGNSGKRYGSAFAHAVILDDKIQIRYGNGATAGTAGGGAGAAGSASSGDGGSGGGASTSGNGGTGGAGAQPGGGGGGGGGCRSGSTSGAGGVGGNGRVRVWVIG